MKRLLPFIVVALLCSCNGKTQNDVIECVVDTVCSCPHVEIRLQPYDDFTQNEANKLKAELEQNLYPMLDLDITGVTVLPNKKLTDQLKTANGQRYRADKIINSLATKDSRSITIALLHKDISVPYKNHSDWGVQGLSLPPKNACVVSTFRLKERQYLWKVASHEFIHAFFCYKHCPETNSQCIMQDCGGKPRWAKKDGLCDVCKTKLM